MRSVNFTAVCHLDFNISFLHFDLIVALEEKAGGQQQNRIHPKPYHKLQTVNHKYSHQMSWKLH